MKQALNQKQILAGSVVVLILVAAAGLAWLGLGGLEEKKSEAQILAEKMGNPALSALMADPGGVARAARDTAELQKMGKDLRENDPDTARWAQATLELTGEGADWAKDPGKWKDRLIEVQSRLQKETKEPNTKVVLAPDFYLGLDAFRQKSPSPDEVPELALHLSVAERLLRLLFKARETREQYPTICEVLSLSGPGSASKEEEKGRSSGATGPGVRPGATALDLKRKKFKIEIRCSPEVLFEYVRLLAGDSALLIVTNLTATNEKQAFPLRSEIAKKFKEPEGSGTTRVTEGKKEAKRLLEILAGKESLNVGLEVDFVAWKSLEPSKPGEPRSSTP